MEGVLRVKRVIILYFIAFLKNEVFSCSFVGGTIKWNLQWMLGGAIYMDFFENFIFFQ